jgi:hypothetical protein
MRVLAGLLLTAAGAVAQTEPAGHAVQPGSPGWPTEAAPTVPPFQPSGVPTVESRTPGAPIPQYPLTEDVAPFAERPLPGSLADEFAREYAERQKLRVCDYLGNRYTLFPNSLLWAPPLAGKIEPRLGVQYTDKAHLAPFGVTGDAIDASFGGILGLWRADLNGLDGAVQLDAFGVALARFSGSTPAVTDYRAGIPLTFRRGDWFGKLAYEHTNSHLGDGLAPALVPFPRPRYSRDEVVLGLGHRWDDQFRAYGVAGYAFGYTNDWLPPTAGDDRKQRYSLGAEWFPWGLGNGLDGQPFVAAQADWRGETDFSSEGVIQAGWLWRNPLARLASVRIYLEYSSTRGWYGQLNRGDRQESFGLGLAADY